MRSKVVRINVSIYGVKNTPRAMVATVWVGDEILCSAYGRSHAEALGGVREQARYTRKLKRSYRAYSAQRGL